MYRLIPSFPTGRASQLSRGFFEPHTFHNMYYIYGIYILWPPPTFHSIYYIYICILYICSKIEDSKGLLVVFRTNVSNVVRYDKGNCKSLLHNFLAVNITSKWEKRLGWLIFLLTFHGTSARWSPYSLNAPLSWSWDFVLWFAVPTRYIETRM